jgi:hypothetical protein
MFKWIKESLFGDRSSEEYNPKHLVVKLPNISEPVISFLKTVRENPKRFKVGVDCSTYLVHSIEEIPDYKAYKIWDKDLSVGWYVKGSRWIGSSVFLLEYDRSSLKFCHYEHVFFLTEDEKEYLIKEISSIMNYRIDRKTKLDKIREDRRIRDTRNELKELYK